MKAFSRPAADTWIQVDLDKLAPICGFGNVPSARTSVLRLLNKIAAAGDSPVAADDAKDDEGLTSPSAAKKSGGRKRKTGEASFSLLFALRTRLMIIADGAEDDAVEKSPSKKKASPAKRKGKKNTEANGEGEDSSLNIKAEKDVDREDDA